MVSLNSLKQDKTLILNQIELNEMSEQNFSCLESKNLKNYQSISGIINNKILVFISLFDKKIYFLQSNNNENNDNKICKKFIQTWR